MMRSVDWRGLSERTLVEAATAGDPGAFDALVHRYRSTAVQLARQLGAKGDHAEDVAQDSLLSAYKSLPQLQDPDRFSVWLGSIVRHRVHRLRQSKDLAMEQLDAVLIASLPSLTKTTDVESEVAVALEALPNDLRVVAHAFYFEHWSTSQIASFLSLPLSTVKWRLHAARQILRPRLAQALEIPYEP